MKGDQRSRLQRGWRESNQRLVEAFAVEEIARAVSDRLQWMACVNVERNLSFWRSENATKTISMWKLSCCTHS